MNRILDIGCGNSPIEGAIGLDLRPYPRIDVQGDATKLPFSDGTFKRVHASQVLEHLDREALPSVFEEVWRVLEDGGNFTFDVPIGDNWDADPTHATKWRFKTIVYFLTRSEVDRLGWDPETFPDYYANSRFKFELVDWDCSAWLWADTLPLRVLSLFVRKLSELVRTDKWVAIPLGSGNLRFTLRKVP